MAGQSIVIWEVIARLISNMLDYVLGPRTRIVYFETPLAFALLQRQQVNARTIVIQNLGRREAERVHVIHNWGPGGWEYQVSPVRACHPLPMQGGRVAFAIDFIRPRESIFITYIYGTPPPQPLLHSIATSEREAERIEFPLAVRRYPNLVIALLGLLALLGIALAAYYVAKGVGMALHALSRL